MKARIASMLALVAATACGQDDAAPSSVDAGPSDACAPRSAAGWRPTWVPPETVVGACTDAQIDEQFRRCESASGTVTDCTAFNRDPVNAPCRKCLYSTEDESTYGPLVYLKNKVLTANIPGCLALADGNLGAAGCGARLQAFQACRYTACMTACTAYDAFEACLGEAGETTCASYRDESACGDPAVYAPCLAPMSFEDYFRAMGKLFCGAGFPGGGKPDAGADAGPPGDARMEAVHAGPRGVRPPSLFDIQREARGARSGWQMGERVER